MSLDREFANIRSALEQNIAPELERIKVQLERYGTIPRDHARSLFRSVGRTQRHLKKIAEFVAANSHLGIRFVPRNCTTTTWRAVWRGVDVIIGDTMEGFLGQDPHTRGRFVYWTGLTPRRRNIGMNAKREFTFNAASLEHAQNQIKSKMTKRLIGTLFTGD